MGFESEPELDAPTFHEVHFQDFSKAEETPLFTEEQEHIIAAAAVKKVRNNPSWSLPDDDWASMGLLGE